MHACIHVALHCQTSMCQVPTDILIISASIPVADPGLGGGGGGEHRGHVPSPPPPPPPPPHTHTQKELDTR